LVEMQEWPVLCKKQLVWWEYPFQNGKGQTRWSNTKRVHKGR